MTADSSRALMPTRSLSARHQVPAAVTAAARALALLSIPETETAAAATHASELLLNALEHSGTGRARISLTLIEDQVTLTVSDGGQSIPAAMRANPSLAAQSDDRILLLMATNPGTTSTKDPRRGTGLHAAVQWARRDNHSLELRSGAASLTASPDAGIHSRPLSPPQKGATASITLQLPQPAQHV